MKTALSRDAVDAAIAQMATKLEAAMRDVPRWALVGIRSGGTPLAARLAQRLPAALRGDVDITLYRDDLYTGLEKPILGETNLPFEINGCGIVLVDDVLFTGRTVRCAMDEVCDFGRPAFIRLAVLIDRGHRELPIAPDYVGAVLKTRKEDRVKVDWDSGVVVLA